MLGYQPFDKRLIVQAAAESGLSEQEASAIRFDDFSDDNRKVTSFLDHLFNRNVVVFQGRVWKGPSKGGSAFEEVSLSEEAVVVLVEHAIHNRIEAPMEQRIQLIKEHIRQERLVFDATIDTRREAQDWTTGRDEASADYLSRDYDAQWDDPLLHHLVINTGKVRMDQAVEIITRLVMELPAPAVE